MKAYPKEVQKYIREKVKGRSAKELAELVNEKYDAGFTVSKMRAYKKNHGLTSGIHGVKKGSPSKTYPKEVRDYIYQNYRGVGPTEMTARLNKMFGTQYQRNQLKAFYKNYGLDSGLDGRFVKGQQSLTKGLRTGGGPERTRFKKGNRPHNAHPIGTRIKTTDGYWVVKIAEPNVWEQIHRRIWEGHNGKIPPGHVVIFGDGDRDNLDISNLILITKQQLVRMNQKGLIRSDAEITRTGAIIADMYNKIAERKRK